MSVLGAHQSIAGGYYKAVERAKRRGCDCVQLSTNNNQWAARPVTSEDGRRFQAALQEHGISHPIAHDSYLINLASPDLRLWKKSVAALVEELRRAEILGIPYVVAHPGAYTTGDERRGLRRVIRTEGDRRSNRGHFSPMSLGDYRRPGHLPRLPLRALCCHPRRHRKARFAGHLFRHLPRLRGRVSVGREEGLSCHHDGVRPPRRTRAYPGIPPKRQSPSGLAAGLTAMSTLVGAPLPGRFSKSVV